jgi:hypothetical protein
MEMGERRRRRKNGKRDSGIVVWDSDSGEWIKSKTEGRRQDTGNRTSIMDKNEDWVVGKLET